MGAPPIEPARAPPAKPLRLLVVCPSWVGDTVMATPALRALRAALPGAFIGALVRPGLDELLAGTPLCDELHVDRPTGMMGPKRVAGRLRMRRYEAAALLTNSFSTALIARLAGIPRRFGYDRDGRGLLLTDRLRAPTRRETPPFRRSATAPGQWAPVPACRYYFEVARRLLESFGVEAGEMGALELGVTVAQQAAADALLAQAGIAAPTGEDRSGGLVMICSGGNDPAKRWPAERFAALAEQLARERGVRVLLSGSAQEAEILAGIAARVAAAWRGEVVNLLAKGADGSALTLGALKGVIRRCALMVTNDTGPRHIAAALGVPVVTLFGPTDHRWTTIPFEREAIVLADPTLPEEEVANDWPQRCAMEKIEVERVREAVERVWGGGEGNGQRAKG